MGEFKGLSVQILILAGTLLFLLLILLIMLVLYMYQRRRFLQFTQITVLKSEFEQTLLITQNEIQEQTLRQISQELHDNISQKLGLLKLQMHQLQCQHPNLNLVDSKAVLVQTISEIRALSKSFHPDRIGTMPLKESIDNELALVKKATDCLIEYNIADDNGLLQPEQKIILFRIFQELLNNVLKYARATQVDITFTIEPIISLKIADNGIGLPNNYKKGIGHTSIQNRVKLLKGNFVLESLPDKGTMAKVEITKG